MIFKKLNEVNLLYISIFCKVCILILEQFLIIDILKSDFMISFHFCLSSCLEFIVSQAVKFSCLVRLV